MLGMLSCAVIPPAIIAFCAWHEEYVGRRRASRAAKTELARMDADQHDRGWKLKLFDPPAACRWNCKGPCHCRATAPMAPDCHDLGGLAAP